MSLIKNKNPQEKKRETYSSESWIMEEQRLKINAYQRNSRKAQFKTWSNEKKIIDQLHGQDLLTYIDKKEDEKNVSRIGVSVMKLNPYEFALAKYAMEKMKAKSVRDLFFKLIIKYVI